MVCRESIKKAVPGSRSLRSDKLQCDYSAYPPGVGVNNTRRLFGMSNININEIIWDGKLRTVKSVVAELESRLYEIGKSEIEKVQLAHTEAAQYLRHFYIIEADKVISEAEEDILAALNKPEKRGWL